MPREITLKNYKKMKHSDPIKTYIYIEPGPLTEDSFCAYVCVSGDDHRFYELNGLGCTSYVAKSKKELFKKVLEDGIQIWEFDTLLSFLEECVKKYTEGVENLVKDNGGVEQCQN